MEAALAPELDPLALPLLDPELLPLLEPLEPLELLDVLPEELPLAAAPLLLPLDGEVLPPLLPEEPLPPDEDRLPDPEEPPPPELEPEPGAVPGNVWPAGVWLAGVPPPPPPVSLELQPERQSARAASAAIVGPVECRRMTRRPVASTGPCGPAPLSLHGCSVAARNVRNDAAVSHARDFAVVGAPGQVDRGYLQKPIGVHVPVVGGFGQSAFVVHSFVQIIMC